MIDGFVEALRPFQVRGWVVDRASPETRLRVRVSLRGRLAGAAMADLFRQDLADAGVGDGRHAFVVNVTESLPLQRPESITVEVEEADGETTTLPMLPTLAIETTDVATKERPPETSVTGFFAVVSPVEVMGWAFDSARPDMHLKVVVEEGGRVVGEAIASRFQRDLVQAGIGSGDHGFVFVVPQSGASLRPPLVEVFAISGAGQRVPLGIAVSKQASDPAAAPQPPQFPSDIVDAEQYPVIVLGAARSGTSAMAQALTSSGVYAGFEEGHFLDLLQPLRQTVRPSKVMQTSQRNLRLPSPLV